MSEIQFHEPDGEPIAFFEVRHFEQGSIENDPLGIANFGDGLDHGKTLYDAGSLVLNFHEETNALSIRLLVRFTAKSPAYLLGSITACRFESLNHSHLPILRRARSKRRALRRVCTGRRFRGPRVQRASSANDALLADRPVIELRALPSRTRDRGGRDGHGV